MNSPMQITIDPSVTLGPVKPVNGVGQPPFFGSLGEYPMFHYLKEAGIPFSRLHDVGGMFGRNVFVDIPNLFRNFDADENDPANYDFAFTDILIGKLIENGVEPFYRLGVSIENYVTIRRYRIDPPKDFAKWARICEHVIRHYTEGWADGFRHTITHWEIWNEPENFAEPELNQMWYGSFEDYCRFYEVASKYLKAQFPHLKIGGYASCGVAFINGWKVERARHHLECFHSFLKFAREHECPLDFYSWHSYSGVDNAMEQARYVREHLDAAGFGNVPMCLNEWLPSPSHEKLGTALQAAEIAAMLLAMQNGPVDSAAIYDARCGMGNYSPLFNPFTYQPHKAYYAFMAFHELRKRGTAVEVNVNHEIHETHETIFAAAALSPLTSSLSPLPSNLALLLANIGDEEEPFTISIGESSIRPSSFVLRPSPEAAPSASVRCRITDETRTWEDVPFPAALPPHSVLLAEFDCNR